MLGFDRRTYFWIAGRVAETRKTSAKLKLPTKTQFRLWLLPKTGISP